MKLFERIGPLAACPAALAILLLLVARLDASAKEIVVDVSRGPVTGIKTTGPAKVRFVGINPFKFVNDPNELKVSHSPSAPPTPSSSVTGGVAAFAAPGGPDDTLRHPLVLGTHKLDDISTYLDQLEDKLTVTRNDIASLAIAADTFAAANNPKGVVEVDAWKAAKRDVETLQITQVTNLNSLPSLIRAVGGSEARVPALITRATADNTAVQGILASYPLLLPTAIVSDSDFERDADVDCAGLGVGGDAVTITLTLTTLTTPAQTLTSNAEVDCLSRIAVSGGFIFSGLPQRTFAAQATNSALPAPPAGAPTPPPATVEESVSSSIRPVPFAFVHYGLSRVCADQCLFVSFGAGANSGAASGSTTVDFAGGLTYGLSRYLFLTGGVHLGQVTELTSGYTVGGPIASGTTTVPTKTRMRTAAFIGITFGSH